MSAIFSILRTELNLRHVNRRFTKKLQRVLSDTFYRKIVLVIWKSFHLWTSIVENAYAYSIERRTRHICILMTYRICFFFNCVDVVDMYNLFVYDRSTYYFSD